MALDLSCESTLHLTHLKYRADIDGLRAIAVLSVVGFHAFPNFIKSGFIGVDIFFVISGFLISSIIFGNLERHSFNCSEFYTRRIKRIFPALIAVLLTSLCFGWYVLLADEFQQLGKHIVAGTSFISNFVLWSESGYFDNAAETKPLIHFWSLAIEEQFYIFWPLLLGILWKRKWSFLATTAVIGIISFAINIYSSLGNPVATFYSPLSRFWELMIGGVLAYLTIHKKNYINKHSNIQSILGFMLLAMGFYLINPKNTFPSYWALLPTLGSFLIISGGSNAWLNRTFLSNKFAVSIGLISYPLYLWHWPLLVWPKIVGSTNILSVTDRMLLIFLAIILAYLTCQLIEKPIRQSKDKKITFTLVFLFLAIGFIGLMVMTKNIISRINSDDAKSVLSARNDWGYPTSNFDIYKSFSDYTFYKIGTSKNITLFVGDSNMEQYAPRVEFQIINHSKIVSNSAIFATKGSCPFVLPELAKKTYGCATKLEEIEKLTNDINVKTIVFAQAWNSLLEVSSDTELQNSLDFYLSRLSKDKNVVLILNMPSGDEFSPLHLLTGSRFTNLVKSTNKNYVDRLHAEAQYTKLNAVINRIATKNNIRVINPFDFFCVDDKCPLTNYEGIPLYKDGQHISATHARSSATFIDETLVENSLEH